MAMTQKQIDARIKSLKASSAKLREAIQEVAANIVAHCIVHGDISAATRLLAAVGKGVDRQTLVWWFEKNAPVRYSQEVGAFKMASAEKRGKYAELSDDDIKAMPKWYEFARGTSQLQSAVDAGNVLLGAIRRLDTAKADKRGLKVGGDKVLEEMKALAKKLGFEYKPAKVEGEVSALVAAGRDIEAADKAEQDAKERLAKREAAGVQ